DVANGTPFTNAGGPPTDNSTAEDPGSPETTPYVLFRDADVRVSGSYSSPNPPPNAPYDLTTITVNLPTVLVRRAVRDQSVGYDMQVFQETATNPGTWARVTGHAHTGMARGERWAWTGLSDQ